MIMKLVASYTAPSEAGEELPTQLKAKVTFSTFTYIMVLQSLYHDMTVSRNNESILNALIGH